MSSSPLPESDRALAPSQGLRPEARNADGSRNGPLTELGSFTRIGTGLIARDDPRFDESLLATAAELGPHACIWQAPMGLVVPRTYRRFSAFETACTRFAAEGWPVTVRQTGGGVVPQGPGIINLSLAYRVDGPAMQHSEPGYRLICRLMGDALADMGVAAFPAAVEGSFCDGRFNLAVSLNDEVVKIAGTAQMWRRLRGTAEGHVGLVHALVLVDVDSDQVTERANAFEAAVGSDRRYRPDRITSLSQLHKAGSDLQATFVRCLEGRLWRTAAP